MIQHVRRLARRFAESSSIAAVIVILGSASVSAQEPDSPAVPEGGTPGGVSRLQDALNVTGEWDITSVPKPGARPSFEDRIRAGTALDSESYRALDSALRRTQQALAERPEDEQARQQLLDLRSALAARIESNMNLGYQYAARVYIALLDDAGAPPEQIETYRQRLAEMSGS